MFDWIEIGFWLRVEILSLLLFPVYKLSRESTRPENMCDIVCEKVKGCGSPVNRASVLLEVSQNSQENICAGISLLSMLNSVDI